jgi:large subunit ribosomal protein L13
MGTYFMKSEEALAQRQWYIVDAQGKVLGRLATEVARVLRGKHKPSFTPHVDGGDFVVVVNAREVRLTGKKAEKKVYYRHSEYPGGILHGGGKDAGGKTRGNRALGRQGHAAEKPARKSAL